MEFSVLIEKMVVFTVLMLLGYFFARRGFVDRSFGRGASMLVMNVFLPATIINSVFLVNLELSAAQIGKLLLILTLTLAVGHVAAAVAAKLMAPHLDESREAVFELLVALSNTMFVGMPVAQELFGPVAVFYCALSCIPFNIYTYTYGVWRLKNGSGSGIRLKDLFSVPLLATLVAVLIFLLRLSVPDFIKSLTGAVNGATMPMSLLVIGFSMGTVSLTDAFKNKQLYLASFLRLLIVPVLTWFLIRLLTDDPVLLLTCMLLAASPAGVLAAVLAIQYDRDGVYGAEGVLQSTILSIVTIPLLILLLG